LDLDGLVGVGLEWDEIVWIVMDWNGFFLGFGLLLIGRDWYRLIWTGIDLN